MVNQEKETIRPDIADYFYPAGTLVYLIRQRQFWEHRGGKHGSEKTVRVRLRTLGKNQSAQRYEIFSVDKRWMAHAETFQRAVHRFGGLGWLLSWCPWTPQWRARSKFARFVAELRVQTLKDSKIFGENEKVLHRFDPSQQRWNRLKYALGFAVFAVAVVALLAAAGWLPVLSTMIAVPFLVHYWVATTAVAYLAWAFVNSFLFKFIFGDSVDSLRFKGDMPFLKHYNIRKECVVFSKTGIVESVLNPILWIVSSVFILAIIMRKGLLKCVPGNIVDFCFRPACSFFSFIMFPLLALTLFFILISVQGIIKLYEAWIAPCVATPKAIATPENNSLGSVTLQLQEAGEQDGLSDGGEVDLDAGALPEAIGGKSCSYILFKPSDDVVTIDEKGAALKSGFFTSLIGGPTASAVA